MRVVNFVHQRKGYSRDAAGERDMRNRALLLVLSHATMDAPL